MRVQGDAEAQAPVDAERDALGLGDVVGVFMPLTPEIVVALLAIAKVGGIILPLFSGFGAGACASRLNDAGAKALFTADGTLRRGQAVNMQMVADEALELPVEDVVQLPDDSFAAGRFAMLAQDIKLHLRPEHVVHHVRN